jgi:hypothetical protein
MIPVTFEAAEKLPILTGRLAWRLELVVERGRGVSGGADVVTRVFGRYR